MRLNLLKTPRKRGMTSLVETLACILLFSFLITILLAMMSYTMTINIDTQKSLIQKLDSDFLVEMMQTDVKSAETIELVDGDLQLIGTSTIHIYRLRGDTLYRDSEAVISDIVSGMFVPADGDSIGIYLRFVGGEIVDITFTR